VETELLVQADRLVGGRDAVLVIDDTALAKKGTYSVGVAANAESAAISGAHGPYTETVDFLEGPADPAPDHCCWAMSRMWQAARQTRRAERVRGP
jgi:hypothetical protein